MLLLPDNRIGERRSAIRGPLKPLFDSLVADLEPALSRPIHMPAQKALLSRVGGRCETDGANLEFDPFSPKSHRCPTCGRIHTGEYHERAWNTWYHLWLAERAVQSALFHRLTGDPLYAEFARKVLQAYSVSYATYPNLDNVLGPTRPFFSTYLESIWLLNICIAADALADDAMTDQARRAIVAPSREIIAQFDEGDSNRQVWNNAALIASSLLLGDKDAAAAVVRGRSGVTAHLRRALLEDGTWFEGDNYHQFAIRGLWYCVTLCETAGIPLSTEATLSFERGIAATFAAALPDFTFPSRKDSQYAVSLRQWRFAELAELGYARTRNDELSSALARCYEPGHERRDTGRSRSTADAERNSVSSGLTRANLGWRALLHALPDLPKLVAKPPVSVHLKGQGYAVFRRPGDAYVAIDYGQVGAGHGHPDRLNLLLARGRTRWLDDLGTGSYVDKSLHWYRSTLAHNAPLVDEHSQQPAGGELLAYDEKGTFGWVEARFVTNDVQFTRTVVVGDGYVIDELSFVAPRDVCVDLPWHVDAKADDLPLKPTQLDAGGALEDGFDFAQDWQVSEPVARSFTTRASQGDHSWLATHEPSGRAQFIRATAPGQPASQKRPFYIVRIRGSEGRLRSVVQWSDAEPSAQFDGDAIVVRRSSGPHVHRRSSAGWVVQVGGAGAQQVELGGRVPRPEPSIRVAGVDNLVVRRGDTINRFLSETRADDRKHLTILELGEPNYRRSEVSWADALKPRATVAFAAGAGRFEILLDVKALNQRFAHANAANPYDNEHPDTMGAGVQLYLSGNGWRGMWMLVPDGDHVRMRGIPGTIDAGAIEAAWRPNPRGYEMRILVTGLDASRVNVVINDAVHGRERRRGQLVAGDLDGEFVYLRGDREDASRDILINFE